MLAAAIGSLAWGETEQPSTGRLAVGSSIELVVPQGPSADAGADVILIAGSGGDIVLDATSLDFDVWIQVLRLDEDGTETLVAGEDDGGVATNARVGFSSGKGGTYRVVVRPYVEASGGLVTVSARAGSIGATPFDQARASALEYWTAVRDRFVSRADPCSRVRAADAEARRAHLEGRPADETSAYSRAIEAAAECAGPASPLVAVYEDRKGEMAGFEGRFSEALELVDTARSRMEPHGGPALAEVLLAQDWLLRELGRPDDALPVGRRALSICEAAFGPRSLSTANAVNRVGLSLRDRGDLAGARSSFERALSVNREHFGSDDTRVADNLSNLSDVEHRSDNPAAALALAEEALAIYERVGSGESLGAANIARRLGDLRYDLRDLDGAIEAKRSAYTIYSRIYGREHRDAANAAVNLAALLIRAGQPAEAVPLLDQAFATWTRTDLGSADEPSWVVYWAVDARLALGTPEPMAPYERALPILDERHGPTDERTLQLMSRVADLLFGKRSFREACSVWEEIARRRARIPVSLRRAVDEGALAICLLSAGRLQDATTWRRASRETASEVLRLQPPGDDEARLAAARSLVEIGLFAESSRLVEELMRSNDARVLEHAASLLVSLGKDPAAEGAYRRALAIRESESPPAPRALASVLDALAVTLERAGRDVEALGLAERAVKVVQQFPLETATLRGAVLSTRAQVRLRLGDADGAGKDLETAFLAARAGEGAGASTAELSLTCLELRDSRGASPCVAILDRIPAAPASRQPFGYSDEMIGVRLVRAAYQLDAGRSDDARRAMADVLHELRPIRSSRVRRQHPILGELVEPLEAAIRGDATAARDVERRLVARRRGRIPRASPGELRLVGVLGEGLVAAGFPGAAAELCRYLDRIVAESYGDDHPERIRYRAAEARYEWQAGRTEVAVDAATAAVDASTRYIRDALELLPEAQALELVRAVPAAEEILFSELVRPPSGRSRASACWAWVLSRRALVLDELAERRRSPAGSAELVAVRRQLATLWVRGPSSDDAEAYRTELDRLIAERDEAERSLAETSDVFRRKQALRSPKLDSVARALPEDGALVEFVRVRIATAGRGDWGERYVALILTAGSRSPEYVDLGPAARLESLIESWKRAVIDSFAPNGIGLRSVDELDAEGRKLRESVWDPIAAKLGEVKVVFMVPDGALQGLSFAALPSENGYLIEHGPAIHTLSTGRDLVRLTSSGASPSPGSGALAAGAPDFAAVAAVEPSPVQEDAAKSVRGSTTACRELWAVKWDALPGAEEELRRIGEQLAQRGPTLVLEHDQATEERFAKEAPKRRVIHIATHAYQWDEGCRRESSTAGARNPLLLSGLVLAGANQANRSVNDSQDGLLTAEEVSLLDLRGTQLVTLSACETGAGTVWEEEGVIGLRRAFEIAGARTVLSSLWPVPDREAAEWMLAFYESLHAGKPVVDAVRSASLAMLERLRKQERPAHPYYWANFSAAGDWR